MQSHIWLHICPTLFRSRDSLPEECWIWACSYRCRGDLSQRPALNLTWSNALMEGPWNAVAQSRELMHLVQSQMILVMMLGPASAQTFDG